MKRYLPLHCLYVLLSTYYPAVVLQVRQVKVVTA